MQLKQLKFLPRIHQARKGAQLKSHGGPKKILDITQAQMLGKELLSKQICA